MKIHQLQRSDKNEAATKEIEWLSVKEVARLMNITERTVQRTIRKYDYKVEKCLGGQRFLINPMKLPISARQKYLQENNIYLINATEDKQVDFEEITTEQKKIALAKQDLIEHLNEFLSSTKLPLLKAYAAFIQKYKNKEFPELYKTLNGKGSVTTLYRDKKTLEENNNDYKSLAPNYIYGKKGPVLSGVEAEALLKFIKYPSKLKIAEIIRWALKELNEKGLVNIRSADTYRRWIEEWKNKNYDQWIFYREGQKALNDKVMFYTKREKNLLEVGDMIIIDGHTTNFEIISPYPPYKPKRMTLVLAYDYRSDMPLGWELMPSENKYAIASAVRRALMFLAYSAGYTDSGMKGRIVNIDNGRANKSKYLLGENKKSGWFKGNLKESGLFGLFEKVFEGVSIAKPYHGQTKTIERFFGVMSEVERLTYTYSGTSIADKPARMMRNEKYHKIVFEKLLQGVALTVEQAHFILAQWFDEYANRLHQDGYYKGHAPKEIFNESLTNVTKLPDFESRLLAKDQLNYLMLEESVTTLYRRGIRFHGNEYWHESFYSLEKGKSKVTLRVKYDVANPDSVLVYENNGKWLGEATKKEFLHPLAQFYGTPDQIQEYQNQVGMQRELKQLTTDSFKDHFEKVVAPELPAAMQRLEEKEISKLEKRNRYTRKVPNGDLDFTIESGSYDEPDDKPDFKI